MVPESAYQIQTILALTNQTYFLANWRNEMRTRRWQRVIQLLAGAIFIAACSSNDSVQFTADPSDNSQAKSSRTEGSNRLSVCPNSQIQLHWVIPSSYNIDLDTVIIQKCSPANPDGSCTAKVDGIYSTTAKTTNSAVMCKNIQNTSHAGCVVDTPTDNTRYELLYAVTVNGKAAPTFYAQVVDLKSAQTCS